MLVGLDKSIRWKFAAGGVPIGVVVTQMQYFVMIYYSQVLGLPASLAGLAIAIALIADAVWDPAVGFVSDNWKSRWGRRHPFMYASIPLISLFYLMLWLPPSGLGGVALFWYLLVCLVGSRLTFALFEIPSSALVPELSGDYEERARLFSYRELVYWVTGSLLGGVLMYAIWLRATPEYPDGFLNPDGYRAAARDCVLLAVVGLLMASVGLHRFIPQLSAPVAKLRFGLAEFLRQVGDVLRLPSLRTMIIAGVLSATAGGVNMVLWVYAMGYFFGMSSSQMSPLMLVSALGGLTSLWLGPRLLAGREKRRVAIGLTLAGATLSGLPIVLRAARRVPGKRNYRIVRGIGRYHFCAGAHRGVVDGDRDIDDCRSGRASATRDCAPFRGHHSCDGYAHTQGGDGARHRACRGGARSRQVSEGLGSRRGARLESVLIRAALRTPAIGARCTVRLHDKPLHGQPNRPRARGHDPVENGVDVRRSLQASDVLKTSP